MTLPVDQERPNGPRSSKGVRTRAKLVRAAKEIFEEHGFIEARISDIADRAELSYGSFYHYFSSKEEIFHEVAATHERELGRAVTSETAAVQMGGDDTVVARFTAANRRYLAGYRQEARLMRVIEQVTRYDTVLDAARRQRHDVFARALAQAIDDLQRRGWVDPDIEPDLSSQALMAMVTRFAEAWFVDGRIDCSFEEGVDQLNRLCLNALRLSAP